MEHAIIESLPLTMREAEAEQEMRANWQPLKKAVEYQQGTRIKRRPILIERMPLTAREQEAETELDTLERGIALPF